jgi:hypothetical protein
MPTQRSETTKSQSKRFIEAARELECDDDKARFEKRLGKDREAKAENRSEEMIVLSRIAVAALLIVANCGLARAMTDEEKAQARARLATISDDQFSASFRCPETFATQEQQVLAIADYVNWASARHPDWAQGQMLEYRYQLLVSHKCAETLRNIQR